MTIKDIYHQFGVPPNLQEHMLRVTQVALFICNHWTGPALNQTNLLQIALLHDLGNVVKFDFDKHPEFLGDEIINLDFWRNEQQKIIAQYGPDDHQATQKMLEEIGAPSLVTQTILAKGFGNSIATKDSTSWELKILHYADLRVMPTGVSTLQARLDEVLNRLDKYKNRPDLPDLVQACKDIERQIQENLSVNISQITDAAIGPLNKKLLYTQI